MAEPKIDEVRFQGYAKTQEYAPLQVPDPNPLLSERLNTVTRSYGNMEQSAEANYLAQEAVRQQDQETRKRLVNFSQTLLDEAVKAEEEKNKERAAEGAMIARRNAARRQQSLIIQEMGEAELAATGSASAEMASLAAQNGADYDVVQDIADLSGWTKYGAYVEATKIAGQNSGTFFAEQLRTDETEIFVGGQPFKIKDAGADQTLPLHVRKAQIQAALAHLEKRYLIESGLVSVTEGLRNTYAQESIDKAVAQVFQSKAQMIDIEDSDSRMQFNDIQLMESFGTDKGALARWYNTGLTLKDSSGAYYTRTKLKAALKALIKDEAGRGNYMDLVALFDNTLDGSEDGQSYAARFPNDLRELQETQREERNAQFKSMQQSDENTLKETATALYNKLRSGEIDRTVANVETLINDLKERGRERGVAVDVTRLEHFRDTQTYTGAALEAHRKDLNVLKSLNLLDIDDPRLDNPVLMAEFGADAKSQSEARSEGGLKKYMTAIDGYALKAIDPQTEENRGDAVLIVAELQQEFERRYLEKVRLQPDIPKAQHAQNAYLEVTSEFSNDLDNPQARYFRNTAGDFPKFRNLGQVQQAQRATNAILKKVNDAYMTQNGLEAFKTDPSLLGGGDAIKAAIETWNKTAQLPERYVGIANYLNEKYGAQKISPMQLLFLGAEGIGQPIEGAPELLRRYTESGPRVQGLVDSILMQKSFNPDSHFVRSAPPVRPAFEGARASISPGMAGLGQLVRSGEGSYTSMFPSENYPDLTKMTIRTELVQFQKSKLRDGRKSAAVGAYQFLYPEVAADRAGLPADAKFTPENQEKMFIATLMSKPGRQTLAGYLQGKNNNIEKAIDELAMEFASIEYRNGRSYYHSDGVNRAKVSRARARAALLSARQEMMGRNS